MLRRMLWRMLALAVLAAGAVPARAAEAYQVSTISSLLAGGYDGDTTVGEMLRHGDFGLGTFNGVDGEMIVLDGQTYRATTDGLAHPVAPTELTPFAVVVPFHPQSSTAVAPGQSLDQLEVPAPPPEEVPVWADLRHEEIREAAARLPDYCRCPFEMRSFERLSYREISLRLGLPMSTVGSRVFRARQHMKRLLLANADDHLRT